MPTVVEALDRAASSWPDRVAWRFDPGRTLTFTEVARDVGRLAAALAADGVGPGDRVAVLLPNRAEHPLTWLALMRLGAAMVPVNVRYRSADAAHVLTLTGATRVVTDAGSRGVLDELDAPPRVLLVDDLLAAGAPPAPVAVPDEAAVVNVQMTSGTTGRPKGCLLTHRYWATIGQGMVDEFPHLGPDDVMLTAQPFSYIDPQWNLVAALLAGAELVVLDGFHPSTFWERVRAHGVTYFYCLAAMPTLLLRQPPDPADQQHRVRAVQCSAIPPALHAEIEERWGVPWFEAFGMTETGADLRVTPLDHDELVGSGCVGAPTAYREARVDPATGELQLRGAGMMDGYLDDPAATEAAFVDGWFRTGDLARLDDEGRVYLVGRLKDMIRRSGENVAAREVEEVLLTHTSVRLVAVTGMPDEIRGEEVRAWVVAEGDVDAAALSAHCAERLARFKVPRYWSFHDDLPRTPSERVEKRRLADLTADVVDLAAARA
ncbi:AMP-binding protein [Solicola sp. PLA-1-18]|uniref:AMP-binding protein n=1 Tax=Solicola sp. PLA-1-18 TaxID=3380532 RepID=UPI003B7DF798